jgi:hypothetical protein
VTSDRQRRANPCSALQWQGPRLRGGNAPPTSAGPPRRCRRAVQSWRDVRPRLGVPQNYTLALAWFREAAQQGVAGAQFNLGVMYAAGRGVARDEAEATLWYHEAAEQGNVAAQNNLGAMYQTGQGVPQDDAQALAWYRKAADRAGRRTAQALQAGRATL